MRQYIVLDYPAQIQELAEKYGCKVEVEGDKVYDCHFSAEKYIDERSRHKSHLNIAVKYRSFCTRKADEDPEVIKKKRAEQAAYEKYTEAQRNFRYGRGNALDRHKMDALYADWKIKKYEYDIAHITARSEVKEHPDVKWLLKLDFAG